MFNHLEKLKPVLTDAKVVDTTVITTDPPSPSNPPPMRFGAARIVIAPDPPDSVITIKEFPRDMGHSDYTVYINKDINGNGNYYAELLTLLDTLTADSHVTIYIGSRGGSLYGGAMIANAIRNSPAEITTVAVGIVASAAALIWSYGHIRKVADGAVLMFHMSSHFDYGNSELVRICAENTVRYVKEVAIDPLVADGLLTEEEAESIIDKRRDFWLDSYTLNDRLEKLHGQTA